jgi:lysophospholipase L1-like esterase
MPSFLFPTYGDGLAACDWAMNYVNRGAVGYREFLRDGLAAEGYDVTYVGSVSVIEGLAHEGHSGWTIGDLDYCIENAAWLEGVEPDIVLLHIGTNDAGRARTPEQMVADLTSLLGHIYGRLPSTTEVIVAQIIPTRSGLQPYFASSDALMNDIIDPYNAQIPSVVDRFRQDGNHVSYVDMGSVIQSDSDFDRYGDHPNVAGYERMADAWLGKILELLTQES